MRDELGLNLKTTIVDSLVVTMRLEHQTEKIHMKTQHPACSQSDLTQVNSLSLLASLVQGDVLSQQMFGESQVPIFMCAKNSLQLIIQLTA